MYKCITLAWLLSASIFLKAQNQLCKIPLHKLTALGELQGINVNDSLLIFGGLEKKDFVSLWVLPSGKTTALDRTQTDLYGKSIVKVKNSSDSVHFYFLEVNNNKFYIGIAAQSKFTGASKFEPQQYFIKGEFIGAYGDSVVNVLSYSKNENKLFRLQIKKHTLISESHIAIPALKLDFLSPIRFISEGSIPSSIEATCSNKAFQFGDVIYFCSDLPVKKNSGNTFVTKVNLTTSDISEYTIEDNTKWEFRSVIDGQFLIKIAKLREKGCIVTKYKLDDFKTPLRSFRIQPSTSYCKQKCVKRGYVDADDNETVWDALSSSRKSFSLPIKKDSIRTLYKIGSHHLLKKTSGPFIPMLHAFPLLNIAGGLIRLATREELESQIVDQYFYVWWDGVHEPTLCNSLEVIDQLVDEYDIKAFKKKEFLSYRRIVTASKRYYGMYQKLDSKTLNIVTFEMPASNSDPSNN